MHISDFRYQIPNGTTAENIFPISVSRFQIPDHIFQISDPRSQGFVGGGKKRAQNPDFQMEKAVQISATDVNSETAHFRILCRQGDYKTRRSHPTEPVGSENRNLRCSLTSGHYKTTLVFRPAALARNLPGVHRLQSASAPRSALSILSSPRFSALG